MQVRLPRLIVATSKCKDLHRSEQAKVASWCAVKDRKAETWLNRSGQVFLLLHWTKAYCTLATGTVQILSSRDCCIFCFLPWKYLAAWCFKWSCLISQLARRTERLEPCERVLFWAVLPRVTCQKQSKFRRWDAIGNYGALSPLVLEYCSWYSSLSNNFVVFTVNMFLLMQSELYWR